MHVSEFKAWFEGFTESLAGPPSKKQWERIKARVAEITPHYTTYPVFIDRYVAPAPYHPYWMPFWTTVGHATFNSQTVGANDGHTVDVAACFTQLGRIDAQALTAQ